MISTSCPHCSRPLNFEDRHAGLEGQCDGCKALLTIPQPSAGGAQSGGHSSDPRYGPGHQSAYPSPADNGLGIAGFVVSLVGLVLCPPIISPIGAILSGVAMQREPKGFAIAGLVIGIVGTVLGIGAFIFWILLVSAARP